MGKLNFGKYKSDFYTDSERNLKTKQTTYELKEYLKTSSLNTLQGSDKTCLAILR